MDVVVARIGKPHGLRGEVTVQLHTDVPGRRLAVGTRFGTRAAAGSGVPRDLTIAATRVHNGIWLLTFAEIPDRTGAESLRGTQLVLDSAADQTRPADDASAGDGDGSDEDAWDEDDLVGLVAVDTTGARLGQVSALQVGAAQDLLVLTLNDGGRALVPFVVAIVPEVDIEAGRVVIDPPRGLLEINAEAGGEAGGGADREVSGRADGEAGGGADREVSGRADGEVSGEAEGGAGGEVNQVAGETNGEG